jgi:hypothetical protein
MLWVGLPACVVLGSCSDRINLSNNNLRGDADLSGMRDFGVNGFNLHGNPLTSVTINGGAYENISVGSVDARPNLNIVNSTVSLGGYVGDVSIENSTLRGVGLRGDGSLSIVNSQLLNGSSFMVRGRMDASFDGVDFNESTTIIVEDGYEDYYFYPQCGTTNLSIINSTLRGTFSVTGSVNIVNSAIKGDLILRGGTGFSFSGVEYYDGIIDINGSSTLLEVSLSGIVWVNGLSRLLVKKDYNCHQTRGTGMNLNISSVIWSSNPSITIDYYPEPPYTAIYIGNGKLYASNLKFFSEAWRENYTIVGSFK